MFLSFGIPWISEWKHYKCLKNTYGNMFLQNLFWQFLIFYIFGLYLPRDSQKGPNITHIAKFGHQGVPLDQILNLNMLVHWVRVI